MSNKTTIGFNRDTSADDVAASAAGEKDEESSQQLSELIGKLWKPADVFAASDAQLTNEQVEEILLVSFTGFFSRKDMTDALTALHFIQAPAGNNLYWLLKSNS